MVRIQYRTNQMLRHYLPVWLTCLWAWWLGGACSSETEALSDGQDAEGLLIEVRLNTRAADANGDLVTYPETSMVGTQHATTVMLYLFKGQGEEAEYCGISEDIDWKNHFITNGGTLPIHTASMTYRLKHTLDTNTPYQFLAVGMNHEGTEAFEVPLKAATTQGQGERGTTLAEAIGQLKSTALKASASTIQRSEIYVGTEPYRPETHGATHIQLYRRVAAVAGWFKNVPQQVLSPVTPGVTNQKVTGLRLSLYTPQNTALPLVPRQQKPDFKDYIFQPAGEQDVARTTLIEMEVPDNVSSTEVIHGGSFVLPIAAPADKETYTLRLELLNAQKQVLSLRRIKLKMDDDLNHGETGGGTGIIDTESAFRFPIIANHYYAIGKPDQAVDLKGNGTDLTITVDPSWKEEADLELGDKN